MKNLEIHPAALIFPMMSEPEIQALADDIAEKGLVHPLVLCDGKLLDGRNRLEACRRADVEPRFVKYGGKDPIGYARSNNLPRRHMNESQRAMCAARALALYKAEAQLRMEAGKKVDPTANWQQGTAAAQAAKDYGATERSVFRAQKVAESGSQDLQRAVDEGRIAVSDAAAVADQPKKLQVKLLELVESKQAKTLAKAATAVVKKERAAELRAQPLPLPDGQFDVIAADFPWKFDLRDEDESHRGRTGYPTMDLDEILAMGPEVLARAKRDCVFLMWAPNAFVADGSAARVVEACGFKGKTLLTWFKQTDVEAVVKKLRVALRNLPVLGTPLPVDDILEAIKPWLAGSPQIGLGHYLQNSTEQLIIATRGSPMAEAGGVPTELRAPRRAHSQKPEEFFALVEKVFPGTKLELFAQDPSNPRPGWAAWGAGHELEGSKEAAP